MIPKAIDRELQKLVRDRDKWKLLAQDRAPVRSADRKREIDGRDKAAECILTLAYLYGVGELGRGSRGCLWDALEALRPDIVATMRNGWDDAADALRRFFPSADDLNP